MVGAGKEGPGTSVPLDEYDPTDPANRHESGTDSDSERSAADPRGWGHRLGAWRESVRRRPTTYRIYRLVIAIVGGAIVVGGLALVPLPGPGWVIVFVGLAVLATEFVWADRLQKFARNQVKAWTLWLGRQSLPIRLLIAVLTFVFVAFVVYALAGIVGVPDVVPDSWIPDLPGL